MGNGHHAVLATCKEVIGLALPPVLVNLHGSKHKISPAFEFICKCSQAGILVIFLSKKKKMWYFYTNVILWALNEKVFVHLCFLLSWFIMMTFHSLKTGSVKSDHWPNHWCRSTESPLPLCDRSDRSRRCRDRDLERTVHGFLLFNCFCKIFIYLSDSTTPPPSPSFPYNLICESCFLWLAAFSSCFFSHSTFYCFYPSSFDFTPLVCDVWY